MANVRCAGLVAGLTFSLGAGMLIPWPSLLMSKLIEYGLAGLWIGLFMLAGIWLYLSAYLSDTRFCIGGWLLCGLCWVVFLGVSVNMHFPAALLFAGLLTHHCLLAAWKLYARRR